MSEIWYNNLKQTLKLSKFHVAWGYKHLKELLKWLQLSNEVSTSRFFSQRICLPKSHMLHTSCQIAAETSARRECSQLLIPTIDKNPYLYCAYCHSLLQLYSSQTSFCLVHYSLKGRWTCRFLFLLILWVIFFFNSLLCIINKSYPWESFPQSNIRRQCLKNPLS